MAIAIKRSPSLSGKDARHFTKSLSKNKTNESKESIKRVIADTKKIMTNFRSAK
jgi:hypothetical protein